MLTWGCCRAALSQELRWRLPLLMSRHGKPQLHLLDSSLGEHCFQTTRQDASSSAMGSLTAVHACTAQIALFDLGNGTCKGVCIVFHS